MSKFKWSNIKRDTILFTSGLGLLIREAIFEKAERPYFLVVFTTMMGLPVFLGWDQKEKEKKKEEEEEDAFKW